MLINKNFRLLFFGSAVSMVGTMLYTYLVTFYLLDLTGKASILSVYLSITLIIGLLTKPILGTIADRLDKRKMMYRLDYILGFLFIISSLLLVLYKDNTTYSLIIIFVQGIFSSLIASLYDPVTSSIIPNVTTEEERSKAYSLFSMLRSIDDIIALGLVAIVYNIIEFEYILLFNGITFIIAAFIEMFIYFDYVKPQTEKKTTFREEFKEGLDYIKKRNILKSLIMFGVIVNFSMQLLLPVTLPYIFESALNINIAFYTAISVLFSVAMLIGSILFSSGKRTIRKGLVVSFTFITIGVLIVTLAYLAHVNDYMSDEMVYLYLFSLPLNDLVFVISTFIMAIIMGLFMPYFNVPLSVEFSKEVEESVRGRVSSILNTFMEAASPVALILVGIIIDSFGVAVALLSGSLFLIVSIFVGIKSKGLKEQSDNYYSKI